MMDGVSVMDTGSNRPLLQMNVESIAEVKVLISNYQAEYGRSSGLQITAVTKSGTNRFRGSVYDVERNSDWNSNIEDEQPERQSQDDLARSGTGASRSAARSASRAAPTSSSSSTARSSNRGPAATTSSGTACRRRSSGRAISRRPRTTSATLYPYIKDPRLTGACTAADQAACFADGGVLGKIPANMLYQTGLNILSMFPLPNDRQRAGWARPSTSRRRGPTESILGWQPGVRV